MDDYNMIHSRGLGQVCRLQLQGNENSRRTVWRANYMHLKDHCFSLSLATDLLTIIDYRA
jgi:hypothetical protein